MALKSVLDSLDGIDEALKEHYTEKDGSFYLNIEDFGKHPGAVTLKTTLNKVNKDKDALAAKVTELETKLDGLPDDFTAEQFLELKAKEAEFGDPEKRKADDEHLQSQRQLYEQRIANLTRKHEADLAALNEKLAERDGYIDKTTKLDVLRKSLREVGVDSDFEDVVIDHLSPSIKVQRADDGSRKAFVETDLGEVDVSGFVKDWAASKGQKFLSKADPMDAKGNNGRGGGAKTMTRAEFDKLDPAAKASVDFTKVTLVD